MATSCGHCIVNDIFLSNAMVTEFDVPVSSVAMTISLKFLSIDQVRNPLSQVVQFISHVKLMKSFIDHF